jgi:Domain of unknown function (DUF3859)
MCPKILPLIMAALMSGCASYPVMQSHLLWAGTYKPEVESIDVKNSAWGLPTRVKTVQRELSTDTVYMRKNETFGVTFDFDGVPKNSPVNITTRWIVPSPGVINAKTGETILKIERNFIFYTGTPHSTWWRFAEPWEMVPGEWTCQVWVGKHLTLEHSFQVRNYSKDEQ